MGDEIRLEIDHARTRFSHPLTHVADALRSCLFPADLRTALYRGLLQRPEIGIDEHAVDLDGRLCVALACDVGARTRELLIDPATGQYAGERETAGNDPLWPVEPDTVVTSSATLTAITDGPGRASRTSRRAHARWTPDLSPTLRRHGGHGYARLMIGWST